MKKYFLPMLLCSATLFAACKDNNDTPEPTVANVYATGRANNSDNKQIATVWKNGAPQTLTDGTNNSTVKSVFVTQ